ncbi:MAG: hypothetical protein SVM79_01160, partial [Chloroflexota bacterium]|nr:hypothetical protein [Chloroflexota bacterium]
MNKILITLLVVAMAIALVVVAGCEGGEALVSEDAIVVNAGTQQTGIWVSGEGKVYAEPDLT